MLRQVFAGPERPTALFLLADFWAPPVYTELRRLGLRVPEDVALVGFDDVIQPGLSDLELTSMAQDFEGIGRTAGECVLRRLAQPDASLVSRVFPTRLVLRHSSDSSPSDSSPSDSSPSDSSPNDNSSRAMLPSLQDFPPVTRGARPRRPAAALTPG